MFAFAFSANHLFSVENHAVRFAFMVVQNYELGVTEIEFYVLCLEAWYLSTYKLFASRCLKNLVSLRGVCGNDILGVSGHVDALARIFGVVDSDAHAVRGAVAVDGFVIGAGEEEVAVVVVEHFAHRSFVAS